MRYFRNLYNRTACFIYLAVCVALPLIPSLAKSEEILYAYAGTSVFVNDQQQLSCTGCKYDRTGLQPGEPGRDIGRFVISTTLGPGLSTEAVVGEYLILREDQGTSCPAGAWYALNTRDLEVHNLKFFSCSGIKQAVYQDNILRGINVVLNTDDGKHLTFVLPP